MTEPFVPISRVDIGDDAEKLVLGVLRSGQLAQGPMVERFEAAFAEQCGAAHAVAVSNGTVALIAALTALGIGPGDEVITSSFTFVATLNAILAVGATARLVDIDPDDFCVDPGAVAAALGPRTAAIAPVHLYGQMADMGAVAALAQRHGLAIVEDAAQAHGACVDGRAAGSFGVGCFSFYATKNVTTGEGGMVTTGDAALAERLRLLRNQGMRRRYDYELAGHNWRMTELNAAIGLPQIERLAVTNAARAANATRLSQSLRDCAGIAVPIVRQGRHHVWHQYTLRVEAGRRDALAAQLTTAGIGHGIYYPRPVDDYDCYADHPLVARGARPQAEAAAASVLSVPVHPGVTAGDCERIAAAVQAGLR